MTTEAPGVSRDALAALPVSYFQAIDAKDVDRIVAHFAEDATFTVQSGLVTFTGVAEIGRMFAESFVVEETVKHTILNIVVDEAAGKVATEQNFVGELTDGTKMDMHNCNIFQVGPDGKIVRLINWRGGS
jgi:ketosteroid isomerase-like protein